MTVAGFQIVADMLSAASAPTQSLSMLTIASFPDLTIKSNNKEIFDFVL